MEEVGSFEVWGRVGGWISNLGRGVWFMERYPYGLGGF